MNATNDPNVDNKEQLHVTVLTDRCAGCEECVVRCPTEALSIDALRWVVAANDERCVGCRQCERTCPFSAIAVEGVPRVAARTVTQHELPSKLEGDFTEIERGFARAEDAKIEALRCVDCPDPTCVRGCPAHNDIPGFIRAVSADDLKTASEILRRTSMLPDICSRVCNQESQCEGACTWSLAGERPVAIGALERFVTDQVSVAPPRRQSKGVPLSVAIVGAGPAGIAAAWELVEADVSVTVYERDPSPGGLLAEGIPEFTLPERIAKRPWRQLLDAGVVLLTNHDERHEQIEELLKVHDGVILANGATVSIRSRVPGIELDGVLDASDFLRARKATLSRSGAMDVLRDAMPAEGHPGGSPVLVLGAGNTALDVARTARRLGLCAICVDWVAERFALARPDELADARAEGVDVRFCRTVLRLEGDEGHVRRAVLAHTRQTRSDRQPKIDDAMTETIEVGLVVSAMGYRVDPEFAPFAPGRPVERRASGLADRRWQASGILSGRIEDQRVGRLALGREAGLQAASRPFHERVWVTGDALVGPSTVVEAMSQGRRTAHALLATLLSRAETSRGEAHATTKKR